MSLFLNSAVKGIENAKIAREFAEDGVAPILSNSGNLQKIDTVKFPLLFRPRSAVDSIEALLTTVSTIRRKVKASERPIAPGQYAEESSAYVIRGSLIR